MWHFTFLKLLLWYAISCDIFFKISFRVGVYKTVNTFWFFIKVIGACLIIHFYVIPKIDNNFGELLQIPMPLLWHYVLMSFWGFSTPKYIKHVNTNVNIYANLRADTNYIWLNLFCLGFQVIKCIYYNYFQLWLSLLSFKY